MTGTGINAGKISDEAQKFCGPLLVLDYGAGELMDADIKTFVKKKLRIETITLFRFYKDYPIPG